MADVRLLERWQARWKDDKSGRWTYELIPDIRKWTKRKHGEASFYFTQVLTGHGCFNAYRLRFKINDSAKCAFCDYADEDTIHLIFECQAWEAARRELPLGFFEKLTPKNIVDIMLESKDKWDAIVEFISHILKERTLRERKIS